MTSPTTPLPFSNRRLKWASDWLLWIVIISVITVVVILQVRQHFRETEARLVRFTFHDANEVSPGSLVKMMGVDVGYVHKVKLFPERVDVWLKLEKGAPPIPDGSTITVLFTGLAGAKSVEIEPPVNPMPRYGNTNNPRFLIQEPIRLKHAIGYQNEIAIALKDGADNFAAMFGRKEQVDMLRQNILNSRTLTRQALQGTVHFTRQIESALLSVETSMGKIIPAIRNTREFLAYLDQETEARDIQNNFHQFVQILQRGTQDIRGMADGLSHEKPLSRWIVQAENFFGQVSAYGQQLDDADSFTRKVNGVHQSLQAFSRGMSKLLPGLQQFQPQAFSNQWKQQLEPINEFLENANQQF